MCLKTPSPELLEEEKQIQNTINSYIDEYRHIKFNAGAGAGKTHALKESLLYIIDKYGKTLKYHNQQILCITYTNVATNEIKERIGNSSLVKVSTIHERVWELIKTYQQELVQIHRVKVFDDLTETKVALNNPANLEYQKFQILSDTDQETLKQTLLENRELYYQNKDKNSATFKSAYQGIVDSHLTRNVAHFKNIVKTIYKIYDYEKCLEKIDLKEIRYQTVTYDSTRNNDSLHRMKISHDTLLEYGLAIVEQYDTLKKIIINRFPYILVDEYQDTAENVIKLISRVASYSEQIHYKLFIGYFGDTVQNIYDTGVGNRIDSLHPELIQVYKQFNRRSTTQIINVINKIRNDQIQQISIYEDSECGSVEFYQGSENRINDFIQNCKEEWRIDRENKLHCFVLKNELVAKYNGFENIYNSFKRAKYYSGINYQALNTELVTYDLTKLGEVQNLFYRVLQMKQLLEIPSTSINSVLNEKIYKDFNFTELFDLIELLKSISGTSLKEFIESLFREYEETTVKGYSAKVDELFTELGSYSYERLVDYILEKLYSDIEDGSLEDAKNDIDSLLSISFSEYVDWMDFVNRVEKKDVIYHTYHATKGLEFDNVVIIMENSFGRNRSKFSDFFTNQDESDENTKNLLYVACSRPKKNLKIFYLDDVTDFIDGIESIFGRVLTFNS